MTVTVHPDRGQPLAGLARALLAVADSPREVRPVTGRKPGYLVSDGVAHAYLSGLLGVHVPPLSLLGVVPAASVPVAEPEPVVAETPAPDPLDASLSPAADSTPAPPKRGPGRPRKTAQPTTTKEVP